MNEDEERISTLAAILWGVVYFGLLVGFVAIGADALF